MTDQNLAKAERAIENLAEALGYSEQEIVSIIREGMETKAPITNQLPKREEYFISEMESTFGY